MHDCALSAFRGQTKDLYPAQTSWLSAAASVQLQRVARLLTPQRLRRNWYLGRYIRAHLATLATQSRCFLEGCGLIVGTDMQLATSVHYAYDRLLFPLDITLKEVQQCLQLATPGPAVNQLQESLLQSLLSDAAARNVTL